MSDGFQQLEAPACYYNANGVIIGYVIRVVPRLGRFLYLNDIGEIQNCLNLSTPVPFTNRFYKTTAFFRTTDEAYCAAKRWYVKHGRVYSWKCIANGQWSLYGTAKSATNCWETVESEVMEFK